MKRFALALILAGGPALAGEASKPPELPKPVLTADEGKKLYAYGFRVGMARGMANAEEAAAQQDVKAVLEKMQPPAKPGSISPAAP